jgi:long-chain acyl-CoA synthetase
VHFVDEIPRTGSGKIIRFRLRDMLVRPADKAS